MAQQFVNETKKWQHFVDETPEEVKKHIETIVNLYSSACVDCFYEVLLTHPDATIFLSNQLVDTRLRSALSLWLQNLFSTNEWDATVLMHAQQKIGEAHARIQVPIHIVLQGSRILKQEINKKIEENISSHEEILSCILYASAMIDIAIEFMARVFVQNTRKEAEKDEAFRLMSLGQDMGLEREIQRAALLEWGQKLLFSLCYGKTERTLSLENSDFGLWFDHKGSALFHGASNVDVVRQNIRKIDQDLLPALTEVAPPPPLLLQNLQKALHEIGFLMDQMFKNAETVESGRDPLTKTLNRRFLPTILNREISIALRREVPFSLLMIDVDHFKVINQTLGHVGGDSALQKVAEILLAASRASDFVFRYGGEEFLVALIETPASKALEAAERFRQAVETGTVISMEDKEVRVTISVGIATFDGYPDYKTLIEAADKALYTAKATGRNRVCVAPR
jgi:diguanylate cyclase